MLTAGFLPFVSKTVVVFICALRSIVAFLLIQFVALVLRSVTAFMLRSFVVFVFRSYVAFVLKGV